MSPALRLNGDVFFCVTEGVGVFLDLKRDEYSAVPIPSDQCGPGGEVSDATIISVLHLNRSELLGEALMVEDSEQNADLFAYRNLLRPSANIFPDDRRAFGLTGREAKDVRVGFIDVVDFLLSCRRASKALKKRHIHDVVSAVAKRKSASGIAIGSIDDLRRQAAIFRKLRPWYPRAYLCLFDGLALVEFLSTRKLFPLWVFAVQAKPFGAHCWIQANDTLLNETTEYASQFTPIMAV